MPPTIVDKVYPENRLFGFTREDGTLHFFIRVQALLEPQTTILDVGCGRGQGIEDPCRFRRDLRRLGGAGRTVIGIDVDPAAASNPTIDEFRRIDDVQRWPVDDASIDLVFSNYVLEHVDDPLLFFREVARVLRPGGHVCIRTPNFLGYSAFIAWLIPNRLHERVLRRVQPDRKSDDVFPTVYRCNTRGKLMRTLRTAGLEPFVYSIEGEPGYLESFPFAYRIAASVVPFLPSLFRSTLLAFAHKPPRV